MANMWARTESIGRKHLWIENDDRTFLGATTPGEEWPLVSTCGMWLAIPDVLQPDREGDKCPGCISGGVGARLSVPAESASQ